MVYFLISQGDYDSGQKFETDEDILNIIETTYPDSPYKESVRGMFLCFRALFSEEKPIEGWLRTLNHVIETHKETDNEL